jgi:putative ABC transport system permease protein
MAGVVQDRPNKAGIQRQIVLPWSRTFQMTRENIFVRLGRSIITASGIFLGIAFMSAVLYSAAATRIASTLQKEQLGLLAPTGGGEQARTIWLVSMSLVVATVGIVNSMLMSVTERYKEIGTMKCLGALDKFIVRLFILEAMLLGVLASVIGALVGSAAMMLMRLSGIGWSGALAAWGAPAMSIGRAGVPLWATIVVGILIGTTLSVLAALYPAWRAAKMPPAAALRSEF